MPLDTTTIIRARTAARASLDLRGPMAATRQCPVIGGTANDTTSNSLNSRMMCFAPAGADLTDIVLRYPGFGIGVGVGEVDLPNGYSVTAAIEYPAGTFTPVYTAASGRSLAVTPGRSLPAFEPCSVVIPAGAQFWVKTWATWTVGNFWLGDQVASYMPGEWTIRGTGLTDQTLTATAYTTTSIEGFGPAVYGTLRNALPVLGVFGDSISYPGAYDAPDPGTGRHFIERAMRNAFPVINVSRGGDSAFYAALRTEGRSAWMRRAITDLIFSMGRNDLIGGAALTQTNLQKLIAPFLARGVRVWGVTVTPYTTSTNNWKTLANQTLAAGAYEPARQTHNAWLRANWEAIGLSGIFDWARVMDPSDSGKWVADSSANLGAGASSATVTLTGGIVTGAVFSTYNLANNAAAFGGFTPSTTVPCKVLSYPGDPGRGAVVTATINGAGQATVYNIINGGAGYLHPPMVTPEDIFTRDGLHPGVRGYNELIVQTGLSPEMFVL